MSQQCDCVIYDGMLVQRVGSCRLNHLSVSPPPSAPPERYSVCSAHQTPEPTCRICFLAPPEPEAAPPQPKWKAQMHYRVPHTFRSGCGVSSKGGIHWTTDIVYVTCPECVALSSPLPSEPTNAEIESHILSTCPTTDQTVAEWIYGRPTMWGDLRFVAAHKRAREAGDALIAAGRIERRQDHNGGTVIWILTPPLPSEPKPMIDNPLGWKLGQCKECGCTTGGGTFCYEHAPYMVYPKADGSFISDRNGRKHISFDEPPSEPKPALETLRAVIVDFKRGTQRRSDLDDCEVETIQKTLNVVLAEIDKLASPVSAVPPNEELIQILSQRIVATEKALHQAQAENRELWKTVHEQLSGWQPIEGYDKAKHPLDVLVATNHGVGEARQHDDGAYGRWFWANTCDDGAPGPGQIYPTHWMPLPALPPSPPASEE